MALNNHYFKPLVQSICHKFQVEHKSAAKSFNQIVALTHRESLFHPWPRAFTFYTEFFVADGQLAKLPTVVRNFLPGSAREFVVQILGKEENWRPQLEKLDLTHAWTNELLVADANTLTHVPFDAVRPAKDAADLDAVYRLEPDVPTVPASLDDSHLFDFVAEKEGQIVGKAQLVLLDENVGYISDMFTAPFARQQGIGRALLAAMHSRARENGRSELILIPSRMTREIGFYEKAGYQPDSPIGVLIPT